MFTKDKSTRSALYAWGGPGTIRLLQTKYFQPKINTESYMNLYDKKTLKVAKELFGTTDIFVSYSWGFSDSTEKEDKAFLRKNLQTFNDLSIKPYAYVQGLNLVFDDWKTKDLFCKDQHGQTLLYSKGRAFTCPNNPQAVDIIAKRVKQAASEDVYGVFVDNILFGLPPTYLYKDRTSFFGCSCRFCQKAFIDQFGYSLPIGSKHGVKVIDDYLLFRRNSLKKLISQLSNIAHSNKKVFGINLYDPWWHSAPYYMGFDFNDIFSELDYYLIENHALTKNSINNQHLIPHLITSSKPTFVVSYRNGIGRDSNYSQSDYDRIYTESNELQYIPCYKATEFKTKGVWHALQSEGYRPVKHIKKYATTLKEVSFTTRLTTYIYDSIYAMVSQQMYKQRMVSKFVFESPLYTRVIKKRRYYE